MKQVAESSLDKVVKIGIVLDKGRGVCSGAYISPSGLVLTCAHCFSHEGIKKVFVKSADGVPHAAIVTRIDNERDLAILYVPEVHQVPYFNLGTDVSIGEQVLSMGSPLGLQGMVTVGWVANKLQNHGLLYVFHSAFINGGNSGGPLVNLSGELIGINEATIRMNMFETAQGLFVAISLPTIREFLHSKN